MFTFFAIFRRLHIQTLHTLCICIWLGLIWFNLIWFFKLYSLLTANVFLCFVSWVDCIDFSVLSSCYSCYVNYRIYICLNKVLYLWNLLLTPPHPSLLIILRIGQSLNNLLLWKHFGQFLLYLKSSFQKGENYVHISGRPSPPRFTSHSVNFQSSVYNLTWTCESVSKVTEYKLRYRQSKVKDNG